MMHMNEVDDLKGTIEYSDESKQKTMYTTFDETFKLKADVEQMRREIQKQKEIVEKLQKAVSVYEVSLTEKDKTIESLRLQINEKEKVIKTEFDNYDKLILNHVDMEKKLISDVEKSTVYVRSFIVAVMLVAASLIFIV